MLYVRIIVPGSQQVNVAIRRRQRAAAQGLEKTSSQQHLTQPGPSTDRPRPFRPRRPIPQGSFMSSELIKHISDASFEADVLKSDKPVLVDYWAEWCGPCKMIAPILDETAKEYGDRLQIAKMNVDDNRDVPAKFGIRGIPTLMLFKGGQLAATKVGALSKAQLTAFLDGHL
jgi:thioredoxin 1